MNNLDSLLLVESGEAIIGIGTYLNPSPSTQPSDIVNVQKMH